MVKTIRNIVCILFPMLACMMMNSCQVIPVEDREWKVDSVRLTTQRALLVEYTGWRCPNCPRAAEKAHEMMESNPGGLVVVECHPATNGLTRPDRGGKDDYTCPEADEYYSYMSGMTDTPFPTGVFDFMPQSDGTYFTAESTWGAQMMRSCQREMQVDPIAEVTYDEESRKVHISVVLRLGETELKELQCVVWLTEDSIVGQQYMPDGSRVSDYVHNHVLRQVLTDLWGVTIPLEGVGAPSADVEGVVLEKVEARNANIVVLLMVDKKVLNVGTTPLVNEL